LNGAIAAKVIIVLVAFPVLVHAIFTVVTMVLGLILPALFARAGDWSDLLHKAVIVATFLLAVRCSYAVCLRLWPVAPIKKVTA
jgi:hypothetical protein